MRGKYGVAMNASFKMPKAEAIPCNCERCRYGTRAAGTIHCDMYDIWSPVKKTCRHYYCVKPAIKSKKKRNKSKGKKPSGK